MTATVAAIRGSGYNASMPRSTAPTKSARINAYLLPSVKEKLRHCAVALECSEADAVAEAIKRLYNAKDIQAALERATDTEKEEG